GVWRRLGAALGVEQSDPCDGAKMSGSDIPVPHPSMHRPRPPARPLQALAVLIYAAVLTSPRAPEPEQLIADARAGHVRELEDCGMTRACVKRPGAPRRSAATLFEIIGRPVPMRSRWSAEQFDTLRVWIAPRSGAGRWADASRLAVRDAFHGWTAV